MATIWLDAAERGSVTVAANAIDRHLTLDAGEKGVPVESDLRQLTVPPLRVLFGVIEQDRIVRIVAVVAG